MNVPNEFAEFFQGIDLTKREIAFLIWLSEWDQNTIRNMRTVLEKIQAAGVADGASSQPSNEPPPCYQPDGDGCAYQCYDGQDEPIDKCKECPLCCSDKQRHYTPPNEQLTMGDAKKERYIWFAPLNDWAKVTPFGVLFFGSEELMTWETLCEEWGYRFKAYRRPPEGEEEKT